MILPIFVDAGTWIFKTISNLNFWPISVDLDIWIFKKNMKLHFWPISVDPGTWSFKIISNVIILEYPLPVVFSTKEVFSYRESLQNQVPRAVYDCHLGWRRKRQRSFVLNDRVPQRIWNDRVPQGICRWPCATERLRWPCATENLRWPLQLFRKTFKFWKWKHI